jgi:hypothetical protein
MMSVMAAAARAFAARIEELRSDMALRLFGAALALANVVTFIQWKFHNGVPLLIGRGRDSLCWPFWESSTRDSGSTCCWRSSRPYVSFRGA